MVVQMTTNAQRVLVFGDSTIENKLPVIRALWQASESAPLLQAFLQQAIEIIQEETQKLASQEGLLFLHCINVLEIAEVYAEAEEPDEIIASVLALVARFGALVLDNELNEGSGLGQPPAGPIHIAGFCTGLLAGAVAACSNDIITLFDVACRVLAVSFRLVVALVRRSNAIEPEPGLWATTVLRVPRQELQRRLDGYNSRQDLPQEKQAYIGVTSGQSWNTVFAPPSVIRDIGGSDVAFGPQVSTAAAMAVHASHLSRPDVDWIIGDCENKNNTLNTLVLPDRSLISTSTGKPFATTTLRGLLESIIADISMNVLDVEATVQGVCLQLDTARPVVVSAMGPSPNIPALARKLAHGGFKSKTLAVISGDKPRRILSQARRRP